MVDFKKHLRPKAPAAVEVGPPSAEGERQAVAEIAADWHPGRSLRTVCERVIERDSVEPRPLSTWHEDIGPVLWWRFPIDEPPYIGTPLDGGLSVEIRTQLPHLPHEAMAEPRDLTRIFVGGWPGYHTHWTPLIIPLDPIEARNG